MGDFFSGNLDEIRIWSTTRSQCDIMSYMNCEIPTTASGLVANYHFNQGISNGINLLITTLTDATGSNTGSLNGGLGFSLLGGTTSNWVSAGSPAQGLSTPTIPAPEINVKGNSVSILDGDVTSSTTDFTDFNGQYTRTFVIESTGTSTLNVGTPIFTGINASDFSVTVAPASVLAASTGTTSFVVAFTPTSLGTKSAVVNIYNSDCSEPIYDFVITATAVTASALNFDGVNDYVETGANLAELAQADFSMEAWIRTTGSNEAIITCANSNTIWEAGEKCFYVDGLGKPTFVGYGNNYILSNISVNNGAWHHVAVVWDYIGSAVGTGKIYIDGVDQTSGTTNYAGNNTNIGTFKLGLTNYNIGEAQNSFVGDMDEVRVWNRVLCLPEIINNMNCELLTPTSQVGLNAYYKFNAAIAFGTNTSVTTATDAAVFVRNGTLTNFSLSGGNTSNWVNPGGVTSGSTCSAYLDEEINIQGNSTNISSGDITPSTADHTDFGLVNVGSVLSRTFVIQNVGTAALSISAYSLSGANASNFTITTNPGASVPAAGSTSIVVSFSAPVTGLKTASLTIANSDCDEGVYRFVINATGVVPAGALNFDGVDDYVQFTDPNLGASDFTLEQWIKPTVAQNAYLLTTRTSEGGQPGNWFAVSLGINGNLALELGGSPGSGGFSANTYTAMGTATNVIAIGNWNHIAVVRSGNSLKLYVNGLEKANSITAITNTLTTGNNILRFGGSVNFNSQWFNGSLDETRIWNIARTQCEIQTYINCEIPNTAAGLVGNYHFNQGYNALNNSTITTVTDASASGNTGTITNFALTGTSSNWVALGGVVSSNTTAVSPVAEIDVQGNGISITDGSTATSTTNLTDFSSALTRTFTILNTIGGGTLNIGNLFITGTNASQFSITSLPSASIVGTGSTNFVVVFTPTSTGVKSATININNNDCSEPLYDFVITATAVAGSALSFDGIDDKADVNGILNPQSSNYSLECWFKINSDATRPTLFKHTAATGTGRSHLYVDNILHTLGTITGGIPLTGTTVVNPGVWYHAAYTWNGTVRKIYLNGILEAWDNTPLEPTTGSDWNFGVNAGNNFLDGSLDEIRMWNSERTQCEIQTYMKCEIPSTASNLVVNYHFNQGIAGGNNPGLNSLTDAAGSNNASLTNFSLSGISSNWTGPGGVVSGSTTSAPPTATLTMYGNGNAIPMGATTSTTNYTDFGLATNRTYVIQNLGSGTLYVNTISFSGANASNFSVTSLPSASIAGSSNSPFIISFTPTAVGSQSAVVNINSNDCTNPTFSFVITASTAPASALDLDNNLDYVNLGTGLTTLFDPLNTITLEAWVKPTSTVGLGSIVGNWQSPVSVMQFLLQRTADKYSIHIDGGSGYVTLSSAPNTVTLGVWQHVAGVWDGSQMRLYINGVLQGTLANTGSSFPTRTNNVMIGGNNVNEQLTGTIDEVRVWTTARTQCEILTYMNCEIPTTASGLVANYHFNQGIPFGSNTAVTALTDATGSYTGTLTNMALTGAASNWVSPSIIANNFTTAAVPNATISITGNGNSIAAGSTSPLLSNFTDFGTTTSRTFVIQSAGGGTMYINSPVTISGVNAGDFTVTGQPASSITTGTTSFVINFIPTALGSRSAIVVVNSSDCTSPNYSFAITASATAGAALNFDGTNDYASTPVFNTQTTDLTLQARVYWNGTSIYDKFIVHNGNTNTNGYGIYIAANSNSVFAIYAGINVFYTGYAITPNQWTNLSLVIENNKLFFYANGVLTTTLTPPNPATPGGNFTIGDGNSVVAIENFNGSIDEVLLWTRPLTQCEIAAYQTCEIATTGSSLIANYHFNQGIASGLNTGVTSLTDASGNGNNLSLSNFGLSGSSSNWVTPGAVNSGSSCPAFVAPEINIVSNALTIPDGNTVTSTGDNTDFGNISSTGNIVRTYTIQNTGASNLAVTTISMSGADASSFTLSALSPASPITASSSAVFSLTFAPTSAGTKSAIVNIINNDCDEATYDFVVTGTSTVGAAFAFDGTNDYINCGTILTASYTKEAWVKFSTSSNGNNFLSAGNVTSGSALWAPGIYNYSLSAGHDGAWNQVQDNVAMVPGNWYHIAVTYDAPSLTMVLYKNGVAVSTNTNVPPFTGNSPLHIGAFSGTFVTTGSMDEVRIWNRPLCQAEIQNNMNCEIAGAAPGLIANYHFNQGVANGSNTAITTLTDASGSSNTGSNQYCHFGIFLRGIFYS